MVKNRIPFVVPNSQIFAPELGMSLKEFCVGKREKVDKMTASTQFRLMNVINPDEVINTPETVKDDVRRFIARMPEERINMKNIGLDMELDAALHTLGNMYLA